MIIKEITSKHDRYCNFCPSYDTDKYYELRKTPTGGLVVNICQECLQELVKKFEK